MRFKEYTLGQSWVHSWVGRFLQGRQNLDIENAAPALRRLVLTFSFFEIVQCGRWKPSAKKEEDKLEQKYVFKQLDKKQKNKRHKKYKHKINCCVFFNNQHCSLITRFLNKTEHVWYFLTLYQNMVNASFLFLRRKKFSFSVRA